MNNNPQFINVVDIRAWLHSLYSGSNVNVRDWINTTLYKHELRYSTLNELDNVSVKCLSFYEGITLQQHVLYARTPNTKAFIISKVQLVAETLPEWQQSCLKRGKLRYWLTPTHAHVRSSLYTHVLDHLSVAYADRPIRLSYAAAHTIANTITLRKIAMFLEPLDCNKGTRVLPSKTLTAHRLIAVELRTEYAYVAEGRAMNHCVGNYWGRTTKIYSIRHVDTNTILCTLEVGMFPTVQIIDPVTKEAGEPGHMNLTLIQAQGYMNTALSTELVMIVADWCREHNIKPNLH